jgi:DNA repair exonuclease SbcCD ATPase subunit
MCETQVQEAKDQEALFEAGRKDRARAELAKVPALQAHVNDMGDRLRTLDKPAMEKRKSELDAQLAAVSGEQTKLDELVTAASSADVSEGVARSGAATAKRNLEDAVQALADVASQVGKPCDTCGKPTDEHDVEDLKAHRAAHVALVKTNLQSALRLYAEKKAEAEAARTAMDFFRSGMTDVSAASEELSNVNETLHDCAELEFQVGQYSKDIEALKELARTKMTEPNPWSGQVTARAKVLADAIVELTDAETDYNRLQAQADLLEQACKVFGPAGVRAHILDTVTPFLNAQTGEYLGALSDGNIRAIWSTLDKTAKGELREKFNIAVTHDKGGKNFKGISGGEKRKVRIATALALQDMVASRATKPINLFMADEIDDALDDAGLERLMGVLDRKAKERGTVLVISHNALTDWIDSVITVTKSGGLSTVGGAAVRTF